MNLLAQLAVLGETSLSLTMSAGVKHYLRTQRHALNEERHFALVDGLHFSTLGSLLIVRVKNSVRPSHLFDHNRDHDY